MPLSHFNKLFKYRPKPAVSPMCNYLRPKSDERDNMAHTDKPTLIGYSRTAKGRNHCVGIRSSGYVPCQVIKSKALENSIPFFAPKTQLEKLYKTFGFSSSLLRLKIYAFEDKDASEQPVREMDVVPKSVTQHPTSDQILDARFQLFSESAAMNVLMPVHFEHKGASKGIRNQDGALRVLKDRVLCRWAGPAAEYPKMFRISLERLEVGRGVDMSEVLLPRGLRPLAKGRAPLKFCKIVRAASAPAPAAVAEKPKAAAVTVRPK